MRKSAVLILALLMGVSAFAQKLKTWEDSLSYAIGVDIANNLEKKGAGKLNSKMMAKGLEAARDGKSLLTQEDLEALMAKFQQKMREQMEAEDAKAGQANADKGKKWLEENKSKPGVKTTASGLQYKVLTEGSGAKPTLQNQVVAHYEGRLIDGTIFDSSYKRGEPATFPLGGVIRGWQEGLQLMSVGSKYELYIPSDMGYGARGYPPDIGPNEVLIFVVELVEVK